MKFIFNGNFFSETDAIFGEANRAFLLGDFISEPVKISADALLLWEEHYFNLMASMRIFRMKIPLEFTQEFLEGQIKKMLQENNVQNGRVEIIVFRNPDNPELLTKSSVSYLIKLREKKLSAGYSWQNSNAEIDIFKDYTINPTFFSQVNSHKPEEIIARAYMQENEFTDLVLLNPDKRIARTVLGAPFLVQDNHIKTPKISEGGIRSVTRNHLCKILSKSEGFTFEESEIFPFELQKTDELFICLESEGILSIHQNRKKSYSTKVTGKIAGFLNSVVIQTQEESFQN